MTDKPVLEIDEHGTKRWLLNGKPHRDDGPAIVWISGDKHWYLNGQRHREDGPAIEEISGWKEWHLNGKLHRVDGPAVMFYNIEKWYLNGLLHREDGPAYKRLDIFKELWYLDGKFVSKNKEPDPEEWRRLVLEYKLKNL